MSKQTTDPATEIYDAAQADMKIELQKMQVDAESRERDYYANGALDAFQYIKASSELQEYMILYRVKKDKEYKKAGQTWEQFCKSRGLSCRNIDRILSDIRPLFQEFSDKCLTLSGISINKIRYLGRSTSDSVSEITPEGIKIDDGEIIPITPENKEEIEAYIDNLKAIEKQNKKEAEEKLRAKERVIENLHKTIDKNERDLKRLTGKDRNGVSRAEKERLASLKEFKNSFDLFYHAMNPQLNDWLSDAPDTVKTEYAGIIAYAAKMIDCLRDQAHDLFDISIYPEVSLSEPDWEPKDPAELANT